jgi:Arc/MetJ-type ribon-helix-helix transcriptional regulator
MYYISPMKTLTVRVPDALATEIETESRKRGVSKSDIVRERLERAREDEREGAKLPPQLERIADLIGSVDDDLPADLSARTKHYLRVYGFGRRRSR